MKASPALALLVGYLVLGAGGGGEAVSQTAPAVALANQLAKTDTSKLSDSVSDFLARLGPMAHSATVDLVASLRDGSGQAHVEQRVPGKGASEARPGVPPAPRDKEHHELIVRYSSPPAMMRAGAWLARRLNPPARWGGTVGAGLEFGFAPNWSVGVEYNHIFLQDKDVTFALVPSTDRIRQDVDMGLVRLNYKFGGPMMGRY